MRRHIKNQKSKIKIPNDNQKRPIILYFIVLLLLVLFINSMRSSLFFKHEERVNVVFYDREPVFYSLGIDDGINYYINFYPDIKVTVPGGYGRYRVGGLKKIVALEKKAEIFKKAFSVATSSFVDIYFYTKGEDVYYGKNENENRLLIPSVQQFFFSPSNAKFIDRCYVFFKLIGRRKSDFVEIGPEKKIVQNEELFASDELIKNYQGYFYKKTYRNENLNVQIVYTKSLLTAKTIGSIIEGEGTRVVDFTEADKDMRNTSCKVIEDSQKFSQTALHLSGFFKCSLIKGRTEISDIILDLGSVETDWEII
jgi:hypothetical protein